MEDYTHPIYVLFTSNRDLVEFWDKLSRKYVIGSMMIVTSQKSYLAFYNEGKIRNVYDGEWNEEDVIKFCIKQIPTKRSSSFEDYLYNFTTDPLY
jgi:hypothetical protein